MKKWWDIAVRAAAFTAVCACVSTNAAAKDIEKIGSTSLCGDTYLRALTGDQAPDKIAALSWQSRSALSRASEAQKALPRIWDDPELLLASELDHIVFGPGEGYQSSGFLTSDTGVSHLAWTESFNGVIANLEMLENDLGISAKPAIQDLKQRLTALKKPKHAPKILYLTRSGGSSGPGTFIDAVIQAAGGENIITEATWNSPDMETLLGLEPDLILTSYFEDGYDSINANPVRHQAVKDYIAEYPRLEISGGLWPCAGPDMIIAAEMLNAKIRSMP